MIIDGYNDNVYIVWRVSDKTDMYSKGFKGGNVSVDGKLTVVDKNDKIKPKQKNKPIKPNYVEGMTEWPYLSHREALQLTAYPQWRIK